MRVVSTRESGKAGLTYGTWLLVAARTFRPVCFTLRCTWGCCMTLVIFLAVVCLASASLGATSVPFRRWHCAMKSVRQKHKPNTPGMVHNPRAPPCGIMIWNPHSNIYAHLPTLVSKCSFHRGFCMSCYYIFDSIPANRASSTIWKTLFFKNIRSAQLNPGQTPQIRN